MLDIQKLKLEVYALCDDTINWFTKKKDEYVHLNKSEFIDTMKIKYEYLYNNSVTLFDRCIIGDLNIQQLDFILEMLNKINNGADFHTTSVAVGQKLVDVYVKPLIDTKE